jgi:hypothetical protein
MKRPVRILLLLTLLPALTFGQSKDNLIGTWKLDKAYILKHNDFEVLAVEKHPYDTIHLNNDNSFYIKCYEHETKVYPSKEERWTINGKWDYKKNSLWLTDRSITDKEKLKDLKYRIILKDNTLYINYGKTSDSENIYVGYYRL